MEREGREPRRGERHLSRRVRNALGGALALATWGCAGPPAASVSSSAATTMPPRESLVEVAVTVDDLPSHGPAFEGMDRVAIADRMLAAFAAHHLPPVYGFVNGKRVDEHPETKEVLRRWIAAGQPLGNHTYAHLGLNDTPIDEYLADIDKGEAILRELVPDERAWRFFRYPFLFEGPTLEKRTAVRAHLAERGYAIAEVTIDGDDWAWNPPFVRCTDRHDEAALAVLRAGYVKTHVEELRFIRRATRELVGRDVRHVLLLHVGPADADALDELLSAYEREGVRFIDLPTALADPIYQIDPASPSRAGAAFPYALARARQTKLGAAPPRPEEDALETTCR
jgi:peptidoglycan/xylan/chitin deacetylase (PgdA/CDA1 family)